MRDIEVIGPDGDDFFLDEDDTVDLKEAFELPDRLPPMRLPSEHELAEAARASRLLERARRLALWAGEHRPVLDDDELTAAESVAAARLVGIEVRDRATRGDPLPDLPAPPAVRAMTDLPELVQLWDLAGELEFIEIEDGRAVTGHGLDDWPGGTDEDVLEVWDHALADTLHNTLVLPADLAERYDLDLTGAGPMALMMLFLARSEGISLEDLGDMTREVTTADLLPVPAQKAWRSWVRRHGDPAKVLVERLTELGAVEVHDGVARLTPLANHAMRLQMIDSGVEVALLPPVEKMTAADLVQIGMAASEEELADESAAWLAMRTPDEAVDELLCVAAAGGPAERVFATAIAQKIGQEAEPRWRRALDEPGLRPYAIMALAGFANGDPGEVVPGLEPTLADIAWLLTDTVAAVADSPEPDELVRQLDVALPGGQEEQVFEQMRRLDHPDVYAALTAIGKHHPDKRVAKAARRTAHKVRPPVKR
jgi:hypothetical protein